jgi:hypothetical protein
VDLYIHSRIRLHGIVLNSLSTGTTLPLHCFLVGSGCFFLLLCSSPFAASKRELGLLGEEILSFVFRQEFSKNQQSRNKDRLVAVPKN